MRLDGVVVGSRFGVRLLFVVGSRIRSAGRYVMLPSSSPPLLLSMPVESLSSVAAAAEMFDHNFVFFTFSLSPPATRVFYTWPKQNNRLTHLLIHFHFPIDRFMFMSVFLDCFSYTGITREIIKKRSVRLFRHTHTGQR